MSYHPGQTSAMLLQSPANDTTSTHRVSKKSAAMISTGFPGDILTKIQYTLQFFKAVRKFTQSIGELADTYWG